MLMVTVDLIPGGNSRYKTQLGTMAIWNVTLDGLEQDGLSDYQFVVTTDNGKKPIAVGAIHGHKRASGYWPLVAQAVKQLQATKRKALRGDQA